MSSGRMLNAVLGRRGIEDALMWKGGEESVLTNAAMASGVLGGVLGSRNGWKS